MAKFRLFISSVQSEFASERRKLCDYIRQDALLGRLPKGLTTAKLKVKHKSIPVNPILAHPAYLAGYIERLGTGTKDLVEACLAKGLKTPEFIEDEDFCTIIWRSTGAIVEKTTEKKDPEKDLKKDLKKDLEKLSDNQRRILELMRLNPYITQEELSKSIGINPKNIRNNILKLKNAGLLTRVGSDKGGYWKVKDKID